MNASSNTAEPVDYIVAPPTTDHAGVEAWAGYPLQFEGMRRFRWQDEMAVELKAALALLPLVPGQCLAGTYMTTDPAKCDVENRLFTNPGAASFPKGITSTRFERGTGTLPDAPVAITRFAGHVHYYRYRASGEFEYWELHEPIARWERVPRALAGDGSCRPVWFALREAAAAGKVEVFATPGDDQLLGIRLMVHATKLGPRSAPVISETFVDGALAAFHGVPPDPRLVSESVARKLAGSTVDHVEQLVSLEWPGNFFPRSPFNVTSTYVQVSPDDERLLAGEVSITPDAQGPHVEITGELFTLRHRLQQPPGGAIHHLIAHDSAEANRKKSRSMTTSMQPAARPARMVSSARSASRDMGVARRFHRQDTEYAEWIHTHQHDGYVLNVAGSGSRLHRADCVHLWRPIEQGNALTDDYPKVCSTSLAELTPMLGSGRPCPVCAP